MEEPIVPLISSSVTGPLGVAHLPRLWLKILLHAAGRLPEGYRHGVGGFDERLCTNLGIDRDAFIAYVETAKPSYLALEDWVREHATKLDPESIEAHNRSIHAGELPEAMMIERHRQLGLQDRSITRGVPLNDLDDWAAMHRQIVAVPSP
ncbi:MAG TPA: DUF5069 domain-containing protein [Candidatus Acidoferrum sp.]|nr:DUF5069 domain-containing protein [Candidatus Acidoferrum sp.]